MFSSTSELFEFNKMIFIYLIALLIGFFWLVKAFVEKKVALRQTILTIPFLLFFSSQFLSTLFSIDRHTSFFGFYGRFNGGLASIIAYLFLYLGAVSLFGEQKDFIKKLFKISLLSSVIVILWGLPGRFGYDLSCLVFLGQLTNSCWTDQFQPSLRMFSTLGQPNWLGAYLAIHFFIGLYFFLEAKYLKNKKQWILYGLYVILNFTAILFTRSRSALLGVTIGGLLFFLFSLKRLKQNTNFASPVRKHLIILTLVLLIPLFIFKTGIDKMDRFLSFGQSTKSAQLTDKTQLPSEITESFDIRKIVWKGAIDLGIRYPLFGTGVETFGYSYYFVRPQEHNLTSEWDFLYNRAHNEYLNYLATTGFIGLISYLILIGAIVYSLLQRALQLKKEDSDSQLFLICLLCSFSTILITNFFGFSTTTISLVFFLFPALGIIYADSFKKSAKTQEYTIALKQKSPYPVIFLIGGTLLFVYGILFLVRYYLADIKYARAINYQRTGDYQSEAVLLNQANILHKEHVYQDKAASAFANLAFIAAYQKETETTKGLIDQAKAYNEEAIRSSPRNVLYWKTKAKNQYLFYQLSLNSKDLKEGAVALQEAERLSPTDPKLPYSLAIYYSLLEDEEKDAQKKQKLQALSLAEADLSLQLKPDYRDGYFLKGQLLKKYKKEDEAKRVFEFILKNIDPSDEETKKELQDLVSQ